MSLREALEQLGGFMPPPEGFKFGSIYAYFAKEGAPMSVTAPSPAERRVIAAAIRAVHPQMKQCFYNSQRLVLGAPRDLFVYCEGFVQTARLPIPIHHGWVLFNTGEVGDAHWVLVDPTLLIDSEKRRTPGNLVIGPPPADWEYVGRAFPRVTVEERWRTGEAGSVVDWPPKWPFLRAAAASPAR